MVTRILEQPIVQVTSDVDPHDAAGSETIYLQPGSAPEWSDERSDEVWPSPFSLATLADGRFRVIAPLDVSFLVEDDSIVAEATEISEFGFGSIHSEAVRDLQAAIVELYLTLRDDQDRLGPDLMSVWETLQDKVRTQHAD